MVEGILKNWYFIFVVLGTFLAQMLLTHYAPGLTRTTELSRTEWGACIVVGTTPLLISFLLKLLPAKLTENVKIDKLVDENKDMSDNRILAGYQKASAAKIGDITTKDAKGQDDNF